MDLLSPSTISTTFFSGAKLFGSCGTGYKRVDLTGYILAFLDEKAWQAIPCINRNWRQLMAPRRDLPRLPSEEYLPGSHDQYCIKRSLHRAEAEAILKQTGVEIPFPLGENFLENYSLGHGAFGEFCIGYAWQKAHYVGIKITLGSNAVEAEATIQTALSKQPHIMPAIDMYRAINPDGQVALYQVMELAGLGSADKLKTPLSRLDGTFKEQILCCLAEGLLQGLSEMHQAGFCHLDIKPNNLAVQHDGTVRLIAFGCSAKMKGQTIDVREENGDPTYFSPERMLGCSATSPEQFDGTKIDAWAAGLTLLVLANTEQSAVRDMGKIFIGMKDLLIKSDAEGSLRDYIQTQLAKIPNLKNPPPDSYERLISDLLELNPTKRLSPSQALQHPWFKKMKLTAETTQKEVCGYLREFVQTQQRTKRSQKKAAEKTFEALSPQDLPLPHFTSFVERPALQNQLEKLLFSTNFSSYFTTAPLLACQGMGGVGKSQLLTYMIHNRKIQDRFG